MDAAREAASELRRPQDDASSYLLSDSPTTSRKRQRAKRKEVRNKLLVSISAGSYLLPLLLLLLAVGGQFGGAQRQPQSAALPDLTSGTGDEPVVAVVGQDAFVSCVAKRLQNYTIIWRFSNEANAPAASGADASQQQDELGSILTAGRQRVTTDPRFSVIQSHDTWLLKISNARLSDTGTYICHTNSEPRVRAIRVLSVLKPEPGAGQDESDAKVKHLSEIDYNFTDCCRAEYVGARCQRLCSFEQLASRYQSINIVHECYSALPSITRCMVAGRNVTDCCERRHIPARCKAMCGHLGDTSAMSVQDQSYCADYSAAIMSCVADGISTLPGQPELVIVEAISSSTLKVSWQKVTDESELKKIDGWIINLTKLSSFADTINGGAQSGQLSATPTSANAQQVSTSFSSSSTQLRASPLANLTIVDVVNNSSLAAMTKLLAANSGTVSLKLDKSSTEFSIDNLKPYTVYQIQMFAYNSLGRSQITDPIRALTLAPESDSQEQRPTSSASVLPSGEAYVEPNLPDTRKCCVDRGVSLKRCLDTLCDPIVADSATIADLMICAPWSNVTFSCLSSRVNHTDCCKARGVSPFCLSMCSGDVKRVDYRHFRCLTHMSTYTNCILESHNVLPSAPLNFTVGPITHSWAVLNWRAPKKNGQSLQGYRIFWRKVEPAVVGGNGTALANPTQFAPSNDEFYYSSAEAATNPYLLDALQESTVYETFVVAVNRFGQSESSVRFVFQTLADPEKLKESLPDPLVPLHAGLAADQAAQSAYNETGCCLSGGVKGYCLNLCNYDMKVSDVSSLIGTCNVQMPVILRCMAGSRNSVPCCRNRGVSEHCLNVCAGLTEHSPLVVATRCASDFGKIIRCMDEGSRQIPSAPIELHTKEVESERVTLSWAPANEDSLRRDIVYHVRYQQLQQPADQSVSTSDLSSLIAVVPLHPLEHNLVLTTNKTEASIDKLKPNSRYSIYVTAENSYGISLPSLVLVVQTPPSNSDGQPEASDGYKRKATLGAPHSLEILRSDTESIVLKWIAPLFINSDAQIKYRVFYKLFSSANESSSSSDSSSSSPTQLVGADAGATVQLSNNWTVIETADTTILLRNLRYSSQYVVTVQAYSKDLLGHMSEILLASTTKPVPPTLNQPLIINAPVEGNNITIMCVALGQPTPQISMFINGLLVQKRTQPYVIYHLVNLARGHLTITCFASNGHGKDYASVQSRTELSVRFAAKTTAKSKEVRVNQQSTARLSCEFTGNPQPSLVWTFTPLVESNGTTVIMAGERVSSLVVAQFDNPNTWTHTLTIKNVSAADVGVYACRVRNGLAESSDSIKLTMLRDASSKLQPEVPSSNQSNSSSIITQLEQDSDLMQCCRSQGVSAGCLPVCSVDGLDVESAFKTTECQPHLDQLMFCAADGSDHRNCCRSKQVPSSCLRWCYGTRLNIANYCFLAAAIDINQCFQEGRSLLPGRPRNIRVMLASASEHGSERDTEVVHTMTIANMFLTDKLTGQTSNQPAPSGDNSNNSVIQSMVMMMGDQTAASAPGSAERAASERESATSMTEPLVIEWDPPAKNPQLVQYYRIFWRPFGSRELSRMVTNSTWIKLSDLNVNKIYEFVVKAANSHGSSVYSDPLTVKPAEILAGSAQFGSSGLTWFMPATSQSLFSRVLVSVCFATLFMFSSLALVLVLERAGYLKGFASSKSNSSRISFANPAYSKDLDGNHDGDNIQWDAGHSLDILAPPPQQATSN